MHIKSLTVWVMTALLFSSPLVFAQKAKPVVDDTVIHLQDKTAFMVSSDKPVFVIKLKSNPTTGYSWFLRESNPALFEAVKHQYEAPADKKLMGASGYELWTFRAKSAAFAVPQQTTIRFVYTRPWEISENATQLVFKVATVSVGSKGE
jgi:inhibitor of cysteine peptidase